MKPLPHDASEIQIQAFCYKVLWNCFPETRYSFFSVPNGGTRDIREMGQLKASGLLSGVADTLFMFDGRIWALEFKDAKGTQSEDQVKFQTQCERQHIPYHIIRNPQEFWAVILPIIRPGLAGQELEDTIQVLSLNPVHYAKQYQSI